MRSLARRIIRLVHDQCAALYIPSYGEWLASINKKTRNMVHKAEKSGITVREEALSSELVDAVTAMFNESSERQGRSFEFYGWSRSRVAAFLQRLSLHSSYLVARHGDRIVGFDQVRHYRRICLLSQILSFKADWPKAPNDALVAGAVKWCSDRGIRWLIYDRMQPSGGLCFFKHGHGFVRVGLIPLPVRWMRRVDLSLGGKIFSIKIL